MKVPISIVALLVSCASSGISFANLSTSELQAYLSDHPKQESFTTSINPVIAILTTVGRRQGPRAAAAELSKAWKIPLAAGEAVLELVALPNYGVSTRAEVEALRHRRDAAVAQVEELAPASKETWQVVMAHLEEQDKCQDAKARDRFFRNSWAVEALLHSKAYDCDSWLFVAPTYAAASPLLYGRIAESTHGDADELVALRAFRDALINSGVSPSAAALVFAQRKYWLRLAVLGLNDEMLREADAFPAANLELILNGTTSRAGVVVDNVELEGDKYALEIAKKLQSAWPLALLEAGRREEAHKWIVRWRWPALKVEAGTTDSSHSEPRDDVKANRELARHLVEDSKTDDIYDVFVDHDQLGGELLDSPKARSLAISYVTEHGYPEFADYLRSRPCYLGYEPEPVSWSAFPADFQKRRAELTLMLQSARAQGGACVDDHKHSEIGSARKTFDEIPLPPTLRWEGPRPSTPLIPGSAATSLAAFHIVRYDDAGDVTAAISLSQDADPVGEVSEGGYWLHLSEDRGKSWREPLYLGLQEYLPYVVVPNSHLSLVKGRTLQIEMRVKELDFDSITFPPVGLRAKRTADNIYIQMSLDDIERDSDGDGLSNMLEDKLQTNPGDPDTDHDGLWDDRDPLPQVSVRAAPTQDTELVRKILASVFGYDAAAIGTGGPTADDEPVRTLEGFMASSTPSQRGSRHRPILFIEGDRSFFQGITLPGRVVVVSAEEASAIRRKYGLFYPVSLHVWSNHAGTRADALWSAGWTGGTLKFRKQDGKWLAPVKDGWIT